MENITYYNRFCPPVFSVQLVKVRLNVTLPTLDLKEEVEENADNFQYLLDTDADECADLYDLAARLMSRNLEGLTFTGEQLRTTYPLKNEDLVVFFHAYVEFFRALEKAKNLVIPQNPVAGDTGRHQYKYETPSWGRARVAAYTGLNFHEIGQLDYGTYLLWLRDAYINMLTQTEEGRDHLDDCWRMSQTKPDRPKLRQKLGKGAPSSGE